MAILKLTLKKQWFDLMLSGEKMTEFRTPGVWIESRLFRNGSARMYDEVEFTNGYGKDKPRFRRRFLGFVMRDHVDVTYPNGARVSGGPFYEILLGELC